MVPIEPSGYFGALPGAERECGATYVPFEVVYPRTFTGPPFDPDEPEAE
jgi:hypothetical protein